MIYYYHILEVPPKAVRGPPPLTPYPEPPITSVMASMTEPPGGWEKFGKDLSSSSSTSTNDLMAFIPHFGGEDSSDSKEDPMKFAHGSINAAYSK